MPDNEIESRDEKLLILPLGEESKKITQVISNDTARRIIELLADSSLSASDISQRLNAPLTTITYNLENLESVGLVKVEKIKYSEKGREVKIYAPVRKLIVLVPEKTDRKSVADMIRRYLGVILAASLASGLIEFFTRNKMKETMDSAMKIESISAPMILSNETSDINGTAMISEGQKSIIANQVISPNLNTSSAALPDNIVAIKAEPDTVTGIINFIIAHPGIIFLLGCLFVIVLFIIMDYRSKNEPK
jgi:DNA-binding transcriptional ArsR family regulator